MDNLNKWLDQVEREIARQEALSEEESRYVLLKSPITYQNSTVSIFFYFTNHSSEFQSISQTKLSKEVD